MRAKQARRAKLATAAILAALGAVAFARPALAENELSVRVSTTFAGAESGLYASGTSSVLVEGEFGYGHDLRRFGPARLWLEGSYMVAQRGGPVFGLEGNLVLQRITFGARLGFAIPRASWLVPHLRVGLGAAVARYGLSGPDVNSGDWEAAFAGHALAGLEILVPRPFLSRRAGRGVTAGLVVDGGLSFATPLRFSAMPDQSGSGLHGPLTGASLGTLDLTAGVLRIGAVLWF